MSANKQQDSHKPPSDGSVAKEEFIRVGTSLYKIVEQPRLNGGYVKKRIAKQRDPAPRLWQGLHRQRSQV